MRPFLIMKAFVLTFLLSLASWSTYASNFEYWQSEALERKLYDSVEWQALLHMRRGTPLIQSHDFILSSDSFSPRLELENTIAFIWQGEPLAVCRFPARYYWLRQQIPELPELSLENCDELVDFTNSLDTSELSLTLALKSSQRLLAAMGHGVLTFGNENNDRNLSLSFFTSGSEEKKSYVRFLFETVFSSHNGDLRLEPLQSIREDYLYLYQQSLWHYELKVSNFHRELMALHLFELSQTDLKYHFDTYNCSTIISFLLALEDPSMLNTQRVWETPHSLARNSSNIIVSERFQPSSDWESRARRDMLPGYIAAAVEDAVSESDIELNLDFQALSDNYAIQSLAYARALNDYQLDRFHIGREIWAYRKRQLEESIEQSTLEVQPVRNLSDPRTNFAERHFQIGFESHEESDYLSLTVLPMSHDLRSDNRYYLWETGVQLAELELLVDTESQDISIDKLTFFANQNMVPVHPLETVFSKAFSFGYDQQFDENMERLGTLHIEASYGLTYRLHPSVDVYGMFGFGVAANSEGFGVYANPSVGAFWRQGSFGKINIDLTTYFNLPNDGAYTDLSLSQSVYASEKSIWIIEASLKKSIETNFEYNELSLSYRRHF